MTYTDIVVIMDGAPDAKFRAEAAADLAKRTDAHLTWLFPRSDFLRGYLNQGGMGYWPAASYDALLKEHEAGTTQRAETARMTFEGAAMEARIESDWVVIDADDNDAVIERARRADLTFMPPKALACLGTHMISAAAIGMACGGPVIVQPQAAPPPGDRILVAWKKNSRESARALRDAWPLIRAAKEVHVLTVLRDGEDEVDDALQRHFERHGVKANLIVVRQAADQTLKAVREHVAALSIDLLVVGLYGRPRLQELVLGGVSEGLIENPPCSLFLSH